MSITSIAPLLVTVADAAKALSISAREVYRLMDRGELRYFKYGRLRRIPHSELEAWLQRRLNDEQAQRG